MEQALFDVLSALETQAEAGTVAVMHPDSAKFISLLAVSKKAKVIVDVGAGVGYSTLWLAYAALATGAR
jgi:predicted O-methyltransferase YrrM